MELDSTCPTGIAIEPLYPQVCQRIPVLPQHSTMSTESHTIRASTKLPQQFILNNSACSDKARLLMQRFWSCVQYWLCSVTFLSLLQFCSFLFFFPPILSLDGVVFLILIIVPVLSTSLVGTGFVDAKILRQATSRNHNNFNIETTFYILWCYGFKFLPSLISCILFHFTLLSSNCHLLYSNSSSLPVNTTSSLFGCNSDNAHPSSSSHQWLIESSSQFRVLSSIQQLQLCLVIIHLCLISYSFVYRDYNVWTSRHYSNALWRITSSIILTGAALYAILMYTTDELVVMATGHVILFTLSGLLVFLVCEFIKLQEIEKNVRYQKRARLDFDTKLGMNSPF
uniref:Transmembrane protein 94 n=1 Tax=Cacopsylla melanoneura TaxID=428564 RepID=A0A8D8R764_9HEMI